MDWIPVKFSLLFLLGGNLLKCLLIGKKSLNQGLDINEVLLAGAVWQQ